MAKKNKTKKWYSIEPIWKKGADYTIAFGQRSGGKTYSALKVCLKAYKAKGIRFVYLRRWTDDVNTFACSTLIKQELIDEIFGDGYEIRVRNHTFILVHEEEYLDKKGNQQTKEIKEDIGYAVAISEAKHRKGTNYPNTGIVLFDEFIDMAGENVLANEYNKFENVISTIKRTNNIRIIMLANTVSKYSEYFTKLGINPDKIEQGEVKEYLHPNGRAKVVVEYCPFNEEIGEEAGDLTNSKMISTGVWEIPPTDEIPSEENEHVVEKLLFTAYEPNVEATIGVYVRYGIWYSYEVIQCITKPVEHEREFLVIRRVEDGKKSSYFHLTNQKSLKQTHYHDLTLLLRDIYDQTEIDVKRELLMGRVFCDNMFTGDIFNNIWLTYSSSRIRELL